MKKWNFFIFFLTLIFFNQFNPHYQMSVMHDHSVASAFFTSEDADYVHPDTVHVNYLKVVPMSITGFKDKNLEKLQAAFRVLEEVVNSEEFKDRILNFKNSKGERAFASNNGLSNEEIYEKFMEGRETLRPETVGEMNFDLKLYCRWWSRVIGYTTPTSNLININYKYFKNFKVNEVASNLAHEWVHKIGFDHRSAAEHDSAPYAIGYIVEELAAKLTALPTQIASRQ
jgi:hypothetical protein